MRSKARTRASSRMLLVARAQLGTERQAIDICMKGDARLRNHRRGRARRPQGQALAGGAYAPALTSAARGPQC